MKRETVLDRKVFIQDSIVEVLQEFMKKLPAISAADLAQWKKQVAAEQAKGESLWSLQLI